MSEAQNLRCLGELETGLGKRISKNASNIEAVAKSYQSMQTPLSRIDQAISKAADERRCIGEDMVSVRARLKQTSSRSMSLSADQIDHSGRIERFERGCK